MISRFMVGITFTGSVISVFLIGHSDLWGVPLLTMNSAFCIHWVQEVLGKGG